MGYNYVIDLRNDCILLFQFCQITLYFISNGIFSWGGVVLTLLLPMGYMYFIHRILYSTEASGLSVVPSTNSLRIGSLINSLLLLCTVPSS